MLKIMFYLNFLHWVRNYRSTRDVCCIVFQSRSATCWGSETCNGKSWTVAMQVPGESRVWNFFSRVLILCQCIAGSLEFRDGSDPSLNCVNKNLLFANKWENYECTRQSFIYLFMMHYFNFQQFFSFALKINNMKMVIIIIVWTFWLMCDLHFHLYAIKVIFSSFLFCLLNCV